MNKQAFTIAETLVTLLAITIMISAPLTFMVRSRDYAEIARNKIISTGLAQEGLEILTSYRNKNLDDFNREVLSSCTFVAGTRDGCKVDWKMDSSGNEMDFTIQECFQENCRLYQSVDSSDMYKTTGSQATDFYRYVTLTPSGSSAYIAESVSYSKINDLQVESRLKKIISKIEVK